MGRWISYIGSLAAPFCLNLGLTACGSAVPEGSAKDSQPSADPAPEGGKADNLECDDSGWTCSSDRRTRSRCVHGKQTTLTCAVGCIDSEEGAVCAEHPKPPDFEPESFDSQLDYLLARAELLGTDQIAQVDLDAYDKNSQYSADIINEFGPSSCGLTTSSKPYADSRGEQLEIMRWLRTAAGPGDHGYGPNSGIQPGPYVDALKQVFGNKAAVAQNDTTLADVFSRLYTGRVVILDFTVGHAGGLEVPWSDYQTVAHFARVFGFELDRTAPEKSKIFIENTLSGSSSYWWVHLDSFWPAWQSPEVSADSKPSYVEPVTRWAVVMDPEATPTSEE